MGCGVSSTMVSKVEGPGPAVIGRTSQELPADSDSPPHAEADKHKAEECDAAEVPCKMQEEAHEDEAACEKLMAEYENLRRRFRGEEEMLEEMVELFDGSEELTQRSVALQRMVKERSAALADVNKKGMGRRVQLLRQKSIVDNLEALHTAARFCDDPDVKARVATKIEATAQSMYSKGFSLRQLLAFVDEKVHKEHKIGQLTTTAEVVFNIIIPETAERKCCYADLFPGGTKKPETLMSHWWGNCFLHLVKAICQHASGKMELFSHMYTEEELDKTFWLCIFGVNQHVSICPSNCPCGSPKYLAGTKCQMDKFALVMKNIPRHALAMDLQLQTLTRVWVLSELDEAMNGEVPKPTEFCGIVSNEMRDDPHVPSIQDAAATYPQDKERIIAEIQRRPNGCEHFDEVISSEVKDQIAQLRAFWLAAKGDTDSLEDEIRKRPALLRGQSSQGRGESLLMMAARYGHLSMVQMLINWEADVKAATPLGWTALHYAAVCFNPEVAVAVADSLLKAKADPDAENSFGRTPLEEACCTDPDMQNGVVELLEAATSKPADEYLEPPDIDDMCDEPRDSTKFRPHPMDAVLFSHWKLRMDSWTRPELTIGIIQPVNGEIQVLSAWVKPIDFGTPAGEIIPRWASEEVLFAALRVEAYIKYRWPLWDFHAVVFKYTTEGPPQHYRVDLRAQTVAQITTGDLQTVYDQLHDKFSLITHVPCSIRFLYP